MVLMAPDATMSRVLEQERDRRVVSFVAHVVARTHAVEVVSPFVAAGRGLPLLSAQQLKAAAGHALAESLGATCRDDRRGPCWLALTGWWSPVS
jgi:hypothetical protein